MAADLGIASIGKAFGTTQVLDDVSIDIRAGEFLSLVGPSGCGKSTLLRIIAGLERQDSGTIAIAGRTVDALLPRQRNIAMVFQNYALYPHMNVGENIATPLVMDRLSLFERLPLLGRLSPRRAGLSRRIGDEVKQVAGQLHIDGLLGRKPGQLSGGQRQRVALARAMVRNPSAFLMDEPLSNLDAKLRVHMRDELAELHQRLGTTFVYVTHDQVEAMTMSDRVALMDAGRILQVGAPAELYERPRSLKVAQFIGSPTINTLPVSRCAEGNLRCQGLALPIELPRDRAAAVLGLRPEAVKRCSGQLPADRVALVGRLRRIEHHGPERIAHVLLDGETEQTLHFRLGAHECDGLIQGEAISLSFNPMDAHIFDCDGQRIDITGSRVRRAA
jgi:multiple sugar transport system ATP-binding protein